MANQRNWEDLQRDLLAGGNSSQLDSAGMSDLTGSGSRDAVQVLAQQLTTLAQTTSRSANVAGQTVSTFADSRSGNPISSLASDLGKASGNFLLKGLTLAPLVRGIFNLFRREKDEEDIEPVRFSLPAPLRTEAGLALDGQTVAIDRGAGGRVRTIRPAETPVANWDADRTATSAMGTPVQNITVQVQAMDSRSFLDHSEDIARAVRDAMLHSHSINDVVNDL